VAERVLLVSADDAVAFAAGTLVERGVELLRERDGATGLAAALRVRPDVVVWDAEGVVVVFASGADLEQVVPKPVDAEQLAAAVARAADRPRTLAQVEREQIERALRHHGGNRTRAARELGISRATLINKIRVYALDL
jgi:transcriptional regulator of acetoin/glycerol metabolism